MINCIIGSRCRPTFKLCPQYEGVTTRPITYFTTTRYQRAAYLWEEGSVPQSGHHAATKHCPPIPRLVSQFVQR